MFGAKTRKIFALILACVFMQALIPANAQGDKTYYWKWTNLRELTCNNDGFNFVADDSYSVSSQDAYRIQMLVVLNTNQGGISNAYYPGAAKSNAAGSILNDNWNGGVANIQYNIPANQPYSLLVTLISYVDGSVTYEEKLGLACSATPRRLSIVELKPAARGSNAITRPINCEGPLYDFPGGQPLNDILPLKLATIRLVGVEPALDPNGVPWAEVFFGAESSGYVPAECLGEPGLSGR